MNSSLEKLVKNLSDNDLKYLTEEFGSKNLELLKQKGAHSYEYMDSFKRFGEEILPDKECFYSSVKDGTTEDNGKTLDGHINDVFEKFIDTCLKFYGLDPCHYFSSPGLSWDVMLKMTCVRLEKILDIDMYLFIEKRLGGGISYIAKRYAKANKKYMKYYDPTKQSKYILYLDMNNLYGWAMSRYLPYGRFKWLKDVNKFDVNSISKNNLVGYILKVDLKYPDELHVLHNDYLSGPEKLAISCDMLSDYCKKIADKYEIKVVDVKKSIPNLGNKTNYKLPYRNLKLHLSLEKKLTKIHRVLKFKYSDWMR